MPVLNGVDAARELKRLMPGVPIILFTQHASAILRIELIVDRVVDRIVEKTDVRDLMGHVKALVPA